MKRRREEEIEDTGDSNFLDLERKKKRQIANADDFWSLDKDKLLVQQIIESQSQIGPYAAERRWNNRCWALIHQRLTIRNQDFNQVTIKDLKNRQTFIRAASDVDFFSPAPPLDEYERLVYDAFEEVNKPAPPKEIVRAPKVRNRLGEVNVNLNSVRTTTTNVNTGSCSSANQTDGENLAELLYGCQEDLNAIDANLIAVLANKAKGNYGCLKRMKECYDHATFIDFLVKYTNAPE